MKPNRWPMIALVFVALTLAACASSGPQAVPAVGPGPAPGNARESVPTAAPSLRLPPEVEAWNQVVAAARKEGRLTLYTFLLTGDPARAVTQAFEQKYGVKAETVSGVGAFLIERVASEHAAGRYVADTMDSALSLVATAKSRGLTQSWGDLPVFAERDVWSMDPRADNEGHFIVNGRSMNTPYLNTTLVKVGEEPKSLKDLLDPRWGGQKIALGSPVTDPFLTYWYVAKLVSDDFIVQFAKNKPLVTPTVRDSISALVRGDVPIVFPYSDTSAAPFIARGATIRPFELAEGAVSAPGNAVTMIKGAPHPNAARLFANWMLSAEGQTILHKANSSTPIRSDVPSFLPTAANIQYKKVTKIGINEMLEISRLQREGTLAKLLGLEK